jgi:hypothetical protein
LREWIDEKKAAAPVAARNSEKKNKLPEICACVKNSIECSCGNPIAPEPAPVPVQNSEKKSMLAQLGDWVKKSVNCCIE